MVNIAFLLGKGSPTPTDHALRGYDAGWNMLAYEIAHRPTLVRKASVRERECFAASTKWPFSALSSIKFGLPPGVGFVPHFHCPRACHAVGNGRSGN